MIREIVKSAKQTHTLNLPDDMIGKTVEVIAFEIISEESLSNKAERSNLQDIQKKYAQYPLISHADFSFDRDEANNYE